MERSPHAHKCLVSHQWSASRSWHPNAPAQMASSRARPRLQDPAFQHPVHVAAAKILGPFRFNFVAYHGCNEIPLEGSQPQRSDEWAPKLWDSNAT